ncbi:Copper resistance protein CRF1 [Fusarium oxysporum f. sp. cubense race 1]|uniref:Copper resistance protein CRF1 n=1 Tax=Fusarium oxysporum f. sp. cubense (strain race 1) TaxID=1229664 RepID=N4UXK1_FUSC1|nr:Copper resistance protein CRF1 [Fusarium oxysporum f. sp. cubense race 1]
MTPKGERFACESCIRGHRVAQCQHTDRPLLRVGRKGRPVSQCTHCRTLRTSRSVHTKCKCASTSYQGMLKQFGRERCDCSEGGTCTCAYKSDHTATNGVPSPSSRGKASTPFTTLSPPESKQRTTENAPVPLQPDYTESLAPSHRSVEPVATRSAPSFTSLNDWPSGNITNPWMTSLEGPLTNSQFDLTQELSGTWDLMPNIGMNEEAQITLPTFDDSLLTLHPFDLGDLFREPDAGQLAMLDNWNPSDIMTTNYHDSEPWFNQP